MASSKEARAVTDVASHNGREDHGIAAFPVDVPSDFVRELDRARRLEAIQAVTAEITR